MNTKHQKSQEGRVFRLSPHCYKSQMAREVMRWTKAEWYWRWGHFCFCPADQAVMPSFQMISFDYSEGEKEKEKRNCIWLFNEEENTVSIRLYWILKKGSPAFCALSDRKAPAGMLGAVAGEPMVLAHTWQWHPHSESKVRFVAVRTKRSDWKGGGKESYWEQQEGHWGEKSEEGISHPGENRGTGLLYYWSHWWCVCTRQML